MADGMVPGLGADRAVPFCETHRGMLQWIESSAEGGHICRLVLASALRAAAEYRQAISPPARIRLAVLSGRNSVFLWPEEARAVLAMLPPAPALAPLDASLRAARATLVARAHECFALADALAGPDLAQSHRAHRLGEHILLDALALTEASPAPEARAVRLFGAGVAGSAAE